MALLVNVLTDPRSCEIGGRGWRLKRWEYVVVGIGCLIAGVVGRRGLEIGRFGAVEIEREGDW